jgi:hypothetical protein
VSDRSENGQQNGGPAGPLDGQIDGAADGRRPESGSDPTPAPADPPTEAPAGAVSPEDIAEEDALVLTTVAVPYGDRLTTYDAAGSGIIWQVPATLQAKIAAGSLPRREGGEGTTAQCVVVDQKRLVLKGLEDDQWPVTVVDEKTLPVPMNSYRERIRQMLVQAARRGESVIFSRPGLAEMEPPCVRSSVVRDDDGAWLSVVEAFPAVNLEGWADAEHDEDGAASRKYAIANEETMTGAAMLMLMAAQTFAPGPEQIGLFFEQSADGGWSDD